MEEKKTALLLIDLQKESQYGIEGIENVVDNASLLIEISRKVDMPIIYTRQVNRSDAKGLSLHEPLDEFGKPIFYLEGDEAIEIIEQVAPQEGDLLIDKYRWSGFHQTSLDLMLKSMGIEHLIIGGFVTDGCVMTSVFDGYFNNYEISLVEDMCGATSEGVHMSSVMIMANWVYGIEIFQTKEIIKKLSGDQYRSWKSTKPDELHFTGSDMKRVFQTKIRGEIL